jgi:ubiquitin C-terminal hydrolase
MQGLQNIGSTCAINTIIQIICRNDLMRKIIIENEFPEDTLSAHLKEILVLMYVENKSLVPRKFVKKLFSVFKDNFNYGEQLDIHELWTFLTYKIISEINTTTNIYKIIEKKEINDTIENGIVYKNDNESILALLNSKKIKNKFRYYDKKLNDNKTSEWQELIQGYLLNITTCKRCKNVLYNFEPYTSINLNIPSNSRDTQNPEDSANNTVSILDMIRQVYKEEHCHDDWKCEKCNEKTEYVKSTKIWSLPDVLILMINRIINNRQKNNTPVDINESLSFNKGAVLNNVCEDVTYDLSSIGMHYGNLESGHYVAICKTDDQYFLYNDMEISKIDTFRKQNSNAYMLAYTKIK